MPAHISHLLFAEESLPRIFKEYYQKPETNKNVLTFGAQGPDIFFHNQRTKPSGLTYGTIIHKEGIGRLCANIARYLQTENQPLFSEGGLYLAGLISHGFLDRKGHPFINYFAGFLQPEDPSTEKYRRAHPFLERILDTMMLKELRETTPNSYNFVSRFYLGNAIPRGLEDLLFSGLSKSYESASKDPILRERLHNAYSDASNFYQFTNVVDNNMLHYAAHRDLNDTRNRSFMALLHPQSVIDSIDFLNLSHLEWNHPSDMTLKYTASFKDIWNVCRDETEELLTYLAENWENLDFHDLEHRIGNKNLSDGLAEGKILKKRYMNPLPLKEYLENLKIQHLNE